MKTKLMKTLRNQKGWSQREIAARIGMQFQSYNGVETGKRGMTVKHWKSYQKVMGLDDATMWQIISQDDDAED